MSATPLTEPADYPAPTAAEQEAQFASVVWSHGQRQAGKLTTYEGTYIAILGESIIDTDADAEVLGRRVEQLADTIPVSRVVLQYVHKPEDWNWRYPGGTW